MGHSHSSRHYSLASDTPPPAYSEPPAPVFTDPRWLLSIRPPIALREETADIAAFMDRHETLWRDFMTDLEPVGQVRKEYIFRRRLAELMHLTEDFAAQQSRLRRRQAEEQIRAKEDLKRELRSLEKDERWWMDEYNSAAEESRAKAKENVQLGAKVASLEEEARTLRKVDLDQKTRIAVRFRTLLVDWCNRDDGSLTESFVYRRCWTRGNSCPGISCSRSSLGSSGLSGR
jgi:hypothetical protein